LGDGVQAEAFIDGLVVNTPIFIRLASNPNGHLTTSLVLNGIMFLNVPTIVGVAGGGVILVGVGGKKKAFISSWGQGNVYSGANPAGTFTQGNIAAPPKPASLMDGSKIFGKTHPQYIDYAVNQFVSVKDHGAKGDGTTDDTAALQAIFDTVCYHLTIFWDGSLIIVWVQPVRGLQDHLLRCWDVHRDLDADCSRGNPDGRRGVDRHRWERPDIPGCQ
jgi:hypothetical protein